MNKTYELPRLEWSEFPIFGIISTWITECDNCQNKVKWHTTGIWPHSIKCDGCGKRLFIPDLAKLDESEQENLSTEKNLDFDTCPQCDEFAWDGRICHSCGAKEI